MSDKPSMNEIESFTTDRKGRDHSWAAWKVSLFTIILCSQNLHAAWEFVPRAGVWVETNDNLSMQTLGERDATRTFIDTRVNLSSFSPRGAISFEPRVVAESYAEQEHERLESTDLYFRSSGVYRWPRIDAGFNSSFTQRTILSSENLDAEPEDLDIEEPPDVETGRVQIDQDRERLNFAANVDFKLSDRNRLRLRSRLIDVQYTERELSGRTSFQDILIAGGIIRRVGDLNEVSAEFFSSEYDATLNENLTQIAGVEGRFSRAFSDIWTFNLKAGVQRADFRFVDEDTNELRENADTNFTYDIGFRRRSDLTTTNINLRHGVWPNAIGYMVERDEIWVFTRRLFTQRFSGSLGLRASRTTSLGDVSVNDDRDYFRVELGLRWSITERLVLDAGFYLTEQEYFNEDVTEATSNRFRIGFNYSGLAGPR